MLAFVKFSSGKSRKNFTSLSYKTLSNSKLLPQLKKFSSEQWNSSTSFFAAIDWNTTSIHFSFRNLRAHANTIVTPRGGLWFGISGYETIIIKAGEECMTLVLFFQILTGSRLTLNIMFLPHCCHGNNSPPQTFPYAAPKGIWKLPRVCFVILLKRKRRLFFFERSKQNKLNIVLTLKIIWVFLGEWLRKKC